jgi:hypothetical protein
VGPSRDHGRRLRLAAQVSALALALAAVPSWIAHAQEEDPELAPGLTEEELQLLEEQEDPPALEEPTEDEPNATDEPSPSASEEESPSDSELLESLESLQSSVDGLSEQLSSESEPFQTSSSEVTSLEDCAVLPDSAWTSPSEWDWSPGSSEPPCYLAVHDPRGEELLARLRTELLLAQALALVFLSGLVWTTSRPL